jgi:hypothetical protein
MLSAKIIEPIINGFAHCKTFYFILQSKTKSITPESELFVIDNTISALSSDNVKNNT